MVTYVQCCSMCVGMLLNRLGRHSSGLHVCSESTSQQVNK